MARGAAGIPRWRRQRGQIEISTTPFYHPIFPLVCDTEIALRSNPNSPVPRPPFRYPEDAREQLVRARRYHEQRFGALPAGLWPSEGSVSDQALEIAAELGFRWFAIGRRRARPNAKHRILARRRGISGKCGAALFAVAIEAGQSRDCGIFPRSLSFRFAGLCL